MNLGFPFSLVQLLVIGPGYLLKGAEKLQIKVGHGTRERVSTRATENARASDEKEASAEERSLRSKRFQSSSCAKAGAKTNKKIGRGRGEEEGFLFSPLLPVHFSFLLSSQLSRRSSEETPATQATEKRLPQMLVGYAFLSKARRCNKYTASWLYLMRGRCLLPTEIC